MPAAECCLRAGGQGARKTQQHEQNALSLIRSLRQKIIGWSCCYALRAKEGQQKQMRAG